MFSRLRSFLTAWTRRDRLEDALDEEVRFHLDAHAEALFRAGVSRREAVRRARIHFGGIEGVKDDCRHARGLRLIDEAERLVRSAPARKSTKPSAAIRSPSSATTSSPRRGCSDSARSRLAVRSRRLAGRDRQRDDGQRPVADHHRRCAGGIPRHDAGSSTVRLSLGARRRHLLAQLLTESWLLAALGGAAALVVAQWTLRSIGWLLPPDVADMLRLELDPYAIPFTAAAALATGLLFGIVPALRGTRAELVAALGDDAGQPAGGRSTSRFRNGLVVAQLAMALTLLVGAGLQHPQPAEHEQRRSGTPHGRRGDIHVVARSRPRRRAAASPLRDPRDSAPGRPTVHGPSASRSWCDGKARLLGLVAAALLATAMPLQRAVRIDPLAALRSE